MADLEYSLEALQEMKKLCEKSEEEVGKLCMEAEGRLEKLACTWKTAAGGRFFDGLSEELRQQTGRYRALVGGMEQYLDSALRSYRKLNEKVRGLNRIQLSG